MRRLNNYDRKWWWGRHIIRSSRTLEDEESHGIILTSIDPINHFQRRDGQGSMFQTPNVFLSLTVWSNNI